MRWMIGAVLSLCAVCFAQSPPVVHLWESGAPGFESLKDQPELAQDYWVRNINNPSITVFLPPREIATGAAVLVIPGGGHRELVFNAEGRDPAIFLNHLGIAAFALKYRLAREANSPYDLNIHPRQDAYRAMRLIRSRAKEWNIDPAKLGVLGFSAGGEVAAMIAYAPGDGDPAALEPIDRLTGRPNFQMLIYPGPLGIPDTVPPNAPPTFMLVADDDKDASQTVLTLLTRYRAAGVQAEAHFLASGGHAFNMGDRSKLVTIHSWPDLMRNWLVDHGYAWH